MPTPLDDQVQALAAQAARAAALTGVAAIGAWTAFVDSARAAANAIRALEAADLIYLDGYTQRDVAEAAADDDRAGVSAQAVADWLARHGPTEYATVRKVGTRHDVRWVQLTGSAIANRRHLAALAGQGWRVVPARWQVSRDSAVSAKALWDQLGGDGR